MKKKLILSLCAAMMILLTIILCAAKSMMGVISFMDSHDGYNM